MKQINIIGDNYNGEALKTRISCRAFIIEDDKILISFEAKSGQLMLPGGGIKNGETLEECLIREVEEETGYIVKAKDRIVTINEYYTDHLWVNHYYACEISGRGNIKLTASESANMMEARWFDIDECLNIFKGYSSFSKADEIKCGMYQREYSALCEYLSFLNRPMTK